MRYQPEIREAYIRMFKIPLVGMALTFFLTLAISSNFPVACYFALTICLLLYLPLFGLLYFESNNWIEIQDDGLEMMINNEKSQFKWNEIEEIRITSDTLTIISYNDDEKRKISYLNGEAMKNIYKTYFNNIGFRPNKITFSDDQPRYLNWD